MNKRKLSWLAIFVVILSFGMVISFSDAALVSGVDGEASSSTTKYAPEQPVETTKATTTSTTMESTTKESTTKESTTKQPTSNLIDIIGSLTHSSTQAPTTSTTKTDSSEQHEEPSEQNSSSSAASTGSTTKKTNSNKTTTTKRYNSSKTTVPAATVTKMTVPHVDNTEIDGTVLDPLDAYFERLSGDTGVVAEVESASETTQAQEQEDGAGLSTAAIIAICLGGIAVLTCAITGVLAVRNKKQGGAGTVEYDDEYDAYEEEEPEDTESFSADVNVDQTSGFTVVSLNDTDYKD